MADSNPSQLILAVPGPEQMRAFPKKIVREAIAKGEIRRSQLIWSPLHNEWKQLRELPHLMPTGVIAPAPAPLPRVFIDTGEKDSSRTARNQPHPQIKTASAQKTSYKVEEKDSDKRRNSITTLVIILLSSIITGTLLTNYFLVDIPFRNNLSRYGLGDLPIHSHLVAFYKPSAALIHIFSDAKLTEQNLPDILVKIAKSTPDQALSGHFFAWISFTNGWYSEYSIAGTSWKKFSSMSSFTREEKIMFLVDNLEDKDGVPLIPKTRDSRTENEMFSSKPASPTTLSEEQIKAWTQFAHNFTQK